MNTLFQKLKSFFKKITDSPKRPVPLPIGMSDFNTWAESIVALSGLPDNDSVRWSLAIMILHLPAEKARVPKQYLADCLRKSAANQVAAGVVQELKTKQEQAKAAQEAAQTQAAEATAADSQSTVAPSEPQQ